MAARMAGKGDDKSTNIKGGPYKNKAKNKKQTTEANTMDEEEEMQVHLYQPVPKKIRKKI